MTEAPFRYREGDRVKLKYNGKTGTITEDEIDAEDTVNVQVTWDESGKSNWEHKTSLQTLHAPRETDPPNPHQAEIDAIDAIRLPLIAELEIRQAVLSKLTAAKKILQKNG